MITDRLPSTSTRTAAIFLAGLLVAAVCSAAGPFTFHIGGASFTFETDSHKLAKAVAEKTKEVAGTFDASRHALETVPGPGGEPAYLAEKVSGLIARTSDDLDNALEKVGDPRLKSLSAWAVEELANIQERLTAHAPVVVARVASSHGNLLRLAAAPKPATVSTSTADQLLGEAKAVIERIFVLASNDDLEVELWVGSTPAEKSAFRFWPQGQIQGAAPDPTIITTNGKQGHVLRGLYYYRAALTDGSVTELIAYPNAAGASSSGLASERLDLVNGTSFFCCRFDAQYCQHVASKKECKP